MQILVPCGSIILHIPPTKEFISQPPQNNKRHTKKPIFQTERFGWIKGQVNEPIAEKGWDPGHYACSNDWWVRMPFFFNTQIEGMVSAFSFSIISQWSNYKLYFSACKKKKNPHISCRVNFICLFCTMAIPKGLTFGFWVLCLMYACFGFVFQVVLRWPPWLEELIKQ